MKRIFITLIFLGSCGNKADQPEKAQPPATQAATPIEEGIDIKLKSSFENRLQILAQKSSLSQSETKEFYASASIVGLDNAVLQQSINLLRHDQSIAPLFLLLEIKLGQINESNVVLKTQFQSSKDHLLALSLRATQFWKLDNFRLQRVLLEELDKSPLYSQLLKSYNPPQTSIAHFRNMFANAYQPVRLDRDPAPVNRNSPACPGLRKRAADLQHQLNLHSSAIGECHKQIVALDAQIRSTQQQIVDTQSQKAHHRANATKFSEEENSKHEVNKKYIVLLKENNDLAQWVLLEQESWNKHDFLKQNLFSASESALIAAAYWTVTRTVSQAFFIASTIRTLKTKSTNQSQIPSSKDSRLLTVLLDEKTSFDPTKSLSTLLQSVGNESKMLQQNIVNQNAAIKKSSDNSAKEIGIAEALSQHEVQLNAQLANIITQQSAQRQRHTQLTMEIGVIGSRLNEVKKEISRLCEHD